MFGTCAERSNRSIRLGGAEGTKHDYEAKSWPTEETMQDPVEGAAGQKTACGLSRNAGAVGNVLSVRPEPEVKTLILDLETVPDYNVWSRPTVEAVDTTACEKCGGPLPVSVPSGLAKMPKCPKMTRGKCRPPKESVAPKDVFAPAYAHRVIVAGCLAMGTGEGDEMSLAAATAPTAEDERGLLGWLAETLPNFDTVVTWGGGRFDEAVLQLRSLHHGVPQPLSEGRMVDLKHVLSPSWRGENLHLDTAAKLIGLPGKNGVDGSMVEAMADSDNFAAIASYCLHDVVQTAYLWLRTELLRGRASAERYRELVAALRACWSAREDFKGFKVGDRVELV